MCGVFGGQTVVNVNYAKDQWRGRLSDRRRFIRLRRYAHRRWQTTRDMRYALRWVKFIQAIDQRESFAR